MMDTSEIRIKMCEMATEIQDSWMPRVGDWFYKRDGMGFGLWLIASIRADGALECAGERMNQAPFTGGLVLFMAPEHYIWLPLQDQLQEMVGRDIDTNIQNAMWSILDDLHEYAFTPNIFNEFIPTSMDQLWLAFVMKEKSGKVWAGEDWIKHSP